ncbi:MAG: hypothetical protein AAF771_09605 [Pseudomonadota bacterium]
MTGMIFRAALFIALQLGSGLLILGALIVAGFGLRDGFCYPGYIGNLTASVLAVLFVAAIVLTPGAVIAGWTLGEMRRRWSFVMVPHWLTFASLGMLYCADLLMRLANEAHCSEGHPEVQDNTAAGTIASDILTYLSAGAAFGALLASGVIVLRMLAVAKAPDAT